MVNLTVPPHRVLNRTIAYATTRRRGIGVEYAHSARLPVRTCPVWEWSWSDCRVSAALTPARRR
jgi:hypothetical protein